MISKAIGLHLEKAPWFSSETSLLDVCTQGPDARQYLHDEEGSQLALMAAGTKAPQASQECGQHLRERSLHSAVNKSDTGAWHETPQRKHIAELPSRGEHTNESAGRMGSPLSLHYNGTCG